MMDVTIVIVTYNSKDFLSGALKSIFVSPTTASYEIIVIDNASVDGTMATVAPAFPEVQFIYNPINLGFASANNQGFALAKGRYVLLLNPDVLVPDNSIDEMVKFLETNPQAGACGTRLLNHDGSTQASCFGFPTLLKEFGHLLRLDRLSAGKSLAARLGSSAGWMHMAQTTRTDAAYQVDYLLGACIMVPKTLMDRYGAMDDNIFMYIEDTELCHRLLANGFPTYHLPWGGIIHFGGQSSLTADSRMFAEYTRSKVYFFRKANGSFLAFLLKLIILMDLLIKSVEVICLGSSLEMPKLQTRYKNVQRTNLVEKPRRSASLNLYYSVARAIIKM